MNVVTTPYLSGHRIVESKGMVLASSFAAEALAAT